MHSGILQVLTATSASLSILPLGRTLDIEKSLKFTADDVVTQSKITGIEAKNVLVSKLLDLPSSHNSYSSGKNGKVGCYFNFIYQFINTFHQLLPCCCCFCLGIAELMVTVLHNWSLLLSVWISSLINIDISWYDP